MELDEGFPAGFGPSSLSCSVKKHKVPSFTAANFYFAVMRGFSFEGRVPRFLIWYLDAQIAQTLFYLKRIYCKSILSGNSWDIPSTKFFFDFLAILLLCRRPHLFNMGFALFPQFFGQCWCSIALIRTYWRLRNRGLWGIYSNRESNCHPGNPVILTDGIIGIPRRFEKTAQNCHVTVHCFDPLHLLFPATHLYPPNVNSTIIIFPSFCIVINHLQNSQRNVCFHLIHIFLFCLFQFFFNLFLAPTVVSVFL